MTKKDFKASVNPATMFINTPQAEPVAPAPVKQKETKAVKPEPKEAKPTKEDKETKSKRLNLLIQPSVLEDFSKVAFMKRTSMNDLINTMIKSYCDAHREEVETYNKYFRGE